MNPGDGSMDGWSWALQGRVTNTETITQQINYAVVNRGLSYESEGTNRNVPVNWATVAERDAAAGPAGTTELQPRPRRACPAAPPTCWPERGNHASSDAPFGIQDGYIFSAVLQAGRTVRNYGFLVQQHRQHRHDERAGVRSVRRRRRPGRAARPGAGPADRRLLPRLTTRTIRTCGATTSGSGSSTSSSPRATCPACRWCASATTTWAASARRSAA